MADASGHGERRQFGRRQDNAHGWIVVEGRPRQPCTVRDISRAGARLDVDEPAWLPFRFRLIVDSRGIDTDCEIRHQQKTSVGVLFVAKESAGESFSMASVDERNRWTGPK